MKKTKKGHDFEQLMENKKSFLLELYSFSRGSSFWLKENITFSTGIFTLASS